MKAAEIKRELDRVQGALGKGDIVPILSHLCFTGDHVFAYNDTYSLMIPLETDFEGALPGKEFISLLNNMAVHRDVDITVQAGGIAELKCGRSRTKLPYLEKDNFIFEMPDHSEFELHHELPIGFSAKLKRAMQTTLKSLEESRAGGICVHIRKDLIEIFSTTGDLLSVSELPYTCAASEECAFVLPVDFVEKYHAISASSSEDGNDVLHYSENMILIEIPGGILAFSKIKNLSSTVNYPALVESLLDKADGIPGIDIDLDLIDAFKRGRTLNSLENAEATLKVDAENKKLIIETVGNNFEDTDEFDFSAATEDVVLKINPTLVINGLSSCKEMVVHEDFALLLNTDEGYMYLVSASE